MYVENSDTVSAFDAKTHLSQLLVKVQKGSRITITKHNAPVASLFLSILGVISEQKILLKIF